MSLYVNGYYLSCILDELFNNKCMILSLLITIYYSLSFNLPLKKTIMTLGRNVHILFLLVLLTAGTYGTAIAATDINPPEKKELL